MPPNRRKILYLRHASEDIYRMIRAEVPSGFELVTLDGDSEAERLAKIADAQVVIVSSHRLSRALIEAAGALELVHHQGVGYHDTVDVEALRERALPLALTTAGTIESVAEHTVLLVLAALRRLTFADAELRRGRWRNNSVRAVARDLAGRTIGYVGMGRIGQAVARLLRAFGTEGLYFDPVAVLADEAAAALGLRPVSFDELLAQADVVTLHVPLTPRTHHLIDAAALARMKPDAVLVNTARGPVVDEGALGEALRAGRLGAAALDVFDPEPPPPDHPLYDLPNVVLTPHTAASTRDALGAKMAALMANLVRFYDGKPLENPVELDTEAPE
ncbi:MAG: NAD(P)-dependent oxidoreductase [Kiloniellales bacterium]